MILAAFFITTSFSGLSTPQTSIQERAVDNDMHEDVYLAHQRDSSFLEDASVQQAVSSFMSDWVVTEGFIEDPNEGLVLQEIEREYPVRPRVFDAAEEFNPSAEFDDLLDLLNNRLLSYYIYIPHWGDDRDWYEGNLYPRVIN
ncbi:MAG: hypothetical protein QCI38_09000, partial [Candidatus Thermoplasmatota archaeon]|nr:hypothetical protein [Candidatus Thermoplasmatota archaeon]